MNDPQSQTWTFSPVPADETYFQDVNIRREDGLAVGVAVQNGDITPDQALANGRLMAAAPEAIAALRAQEDLSRRGLAFVSAGEIEHAKTLRRAALAKADGAEPKLIAEMLRRLPGVLDDSTYEQVESALDRADAPVREGGDRGRFLKLHERIDALRNKTRGAPG